MLPGFAMLRFLAAICLTVFALSSFAQAAKPAEKARFDIYEYAVEGNSVLPAIAIEKAVYAFLGPGRSLDDIEAARVALEKAYQDAGYLTVLVEIPDQRVQEGLVRLRVVEGNVEKLKITGSRYFSLGQIHAGTPSLAAGNVPQFTEVQQELAQLSRTPDRRLNPVLRAGKKPGTVEVELQVEDKLPLHGSLEWNNKRSPGTTTGRVEANLRYDNLWQRQHSLALGYITSPQDRREVKVLTANYTLPVDREKGTALALFGVFSDSNVPTVQDSQVIGNGTSIGLRYIHPLPGSDRLYHSLSFGGDYKDFKEIRTLDQGRRPIKYSSLAFQYSGTALDSNGQWQIGVGATFGLRSTGEYTVEDCDGVRKDQFDCKRAGAQSNFLAVRIDLARQQALGSGWLLNARLNSQLAEQALISNEQFSAGGVASVRGYLDAERLGDKGVRASLEVETPSLFGEHWMQLNLLAFYDFAYLRTNQPLPGEAGSSRLAGTGLGLKLKGGKHWVLNAYGARALRNGSEGNTRSGDTRVHANLAVEF